MVNPHVILDSVEIGAFRVNCGHLTTSLKVALCGRAENLVLFVEPFGDEIGVEVCDAILDFASLTVVAGPVRIPRDADQRSELMSITIPK
jgi:hypothetical protein